MSNSQLGDSSSETSRQNGRRVVTGVGADGKSIILYDDNKGHVWTPEPNGTKFQYLWWTDKVPVEISSDADKDPTVGGKNFQISNQGSVAVFVWMKPGGSSPLHFTHSIDYAFVIEGEIELELDGGDKTLLKAGDSVVQRQTNHKWYNPHPTRWSKMFFVLVASTTALKANP